MNDEHWSAVYDSARAVRVHALGPFGLTDRQARFLVTVMAHSGGFLERQYCAFAGIARGQNSRNFVAGLVARGYATAITHGSVRRGRIYHVHHKPLYEANRPLTSQAIGVLLSNQRYAGIVDVLEYGVRGKRGDFEPLFSEDTFFRVQSVLSVTPPARRPVCRAVRTSRCAGSSETSRADEGSPGAGRRSN